MNKELTSVIYTLEERLLNSEIRKSAEKIAELLSEDFFEHCNSGDIWYYYVGDIIDQNENENTVKLEIKDFSAKLLTSDIVLATYKSIKYDEKKGDKEFSLRSSIWKCFNGSWKMVFHQGTPTNQYGKR